MELAADLAADGMRATSLTWDLLKGLLRDRAAQLGRKRTPVGLAALFATLAAIGGTTLVLSVPAGASGSGPATPSRTQPGLYSTCRAFGKAGPPATRDDPPSTTRSRSCQSHHDDADR